MSSRAEGVVDDILRPLIQADGGTIQIDAMDGERLSITLGGACIGCPGVHFTRTYVIEPALRKALPSGMDIEVTNAVRSPVSRSTPGSDR